MVWLGQQATILPLSSIGGWSGSILIYILWAVGYRWDIHGLLVAVGWAIGSWFGSILIYTLHLHDYVYNEKEVGFSLNESLKRQNTHGLRVGFFVLALTTPLAVARSVLPAANNLSLRQGERANCRVDWCIRRAAT